MPELTDYSGPFKPDLRLEDLSKDFLIELIWEYQWAWLILMDEWYDAVKKRSGSEVASQCEGEAMVKMAARVNPRYAKLANIQLNTVLDSLKLAQLPLDNTRQDALYPAHNFDIKSLNHVIMTVTKCISLEAFERDRTPERIQQVCHTLEKPLIEKYLVNPNIKVTALKLPPRNSRDEIACQWEFKIEE